MTSQRSVGETREGAFEIATDGGDVVTRIVSAVADREGVEPTALETPLYEAIDAEALSTLVEDAPESGLTVGFDYAGYRVTVVADEDVHVDVVAEQ